MTTRLTKRVERETEARAGRGTRRNLIVALLPGDVIELREKGTRKRWLLPVDAAFSVAVKMEVAAAKRAKAEARKAKKGGGK